MGNETESFCGYGFASATTIGAGGAEWIQEWGKPPVGWFLSGGRRGAGFLEVGVSGFERTMATGAPEIGDDLVLSQPYRGKIVLTACDRVTGRETGAVAGVLEGSFVADLNAAHAEIIGPTIAIRFGAPYHAGPDAAIEVSETSGTLQGIRAAGKWEERVFGRITIARVPTLSVQANIFAFLKNSALILRAEEEIVLSGSFARAAS